MSYAFALKLLSVGCLVSMLWLRPRHCAAEQLPAPLPDRDSPSGAVSFASEQEPPGIGFEVNVLWPFFPGGITEFRLLVPVLGSGTGLRSELVLGAYADFASRVVRDDQDGKVRNLSGKLGIRQYLFHGVHVEASANLGWRNEVERPDGASYDAFHARLWLLAGYQHELTPLFYANARGGLGIHLYRSDRFAAEERQLAPGADLNLGVRF